MPGVGGAQHGARGLAEELEDWSLLYVELWLQAMREPSLRPRMQQIHQWSRQSVAQMIDQQAQARGVTLAMPAGDLAEALLALGNGLMMQHVLAPSKRTAQTYRLALHAMLRDAIQSADTERSSPVTACTQCSQVMPVTW